MCGRYTVLDTQKIKARFNIDDTIYDGALKENYNVAPGQDLPVITHDDQGNHLKIMKWGLVPRWAKDPSIGFKTINARIESLLEKPAFKKPFLENRIIVPANGFYEWQHSGERKIPFYIRPKNDELWGFAGLYDIWEEEPFGTKLYSFTIITLNPTPELGKIHNRMPAIIPQDREDEWLSETQDPKSLLKIFDPQKISYNFYQVSDKVNRTANTGPELIKKYQDHNLFS